MPAGGWRSVRVRSATGYARWFGAATLDGVWLATAVGGEALPYGHGFPARIVAPGRRGEVTPDRVGLPVGAVLVAGQFRGTDEVRKPRHPGLPRRSSVSTDCHLRRR